MPPDSATYSVTFGIFFEAVRRGERAEKKRQVECGAGTSGARGDSPGERSWARQWTNYMLIVSEGRRPCMVRQSLSATATKPIRHPSASNFGASHPSPASTANLAQMSTSPPITACRSKLRRSPPSGLHFDCFGRAPASENDTQPADYCSQNHWPGASKKLCRIPI